MRLIAKWINWHSSSVEGYCILVELDHNYKVKELEKEFEEFFPKYKFNGMDTSVKTWLNHKIHYIIYAEEKKAYKKRIYGIIEDEISKIEEQFEDCNEKIQKIVSIELQKEKERYFHRDIKTYFL